ILATGNGGAHIVAAKWSAGDALGADGRIAGGDRLFLAGDTGSNVTSLSADGRTIFERAVSELLRPTLEVTVSTGPAPGHTYVIIDNDTAADPVTGIFRNQLEGSVVTATGGEQFVISYLGGDGNDVVLYGGVETQVGVKDGVLSITDITTDSVNDITVTYDSGANTYTISEADVANVIATSGATVISRTANSVTIDATGINEISIDVTGPETSNAGLEAGDTVSLNGLQSDIDGAVTVTAEKINLGADLVADAITLNGDVTLTADVLLDTEDVNGSIAMNGAVDGTFDLTINTGTGAATVTGEVGGIAALDAFTVLKGNTTLQGGLTADDLNVATVTDADPVPATATLTVTGGDVSIGNGDGDETIAIGTRDASYAANSSTITGTVDFSAAASVTINVDTVALGTMTNTSGSEGTASGHLELSDAGLNAVTAVNIVVGDSPARGNSITSSVEFGGGTNNVNVDVFTVGGRKTNASVTIDSGGTLNLGGHLNAATDLSVGRNAANTGNVVVAVFDMSAGTFNATLDEVVVGLHNAGNGSGTGTLSFDTGTVTANSILLADPDASGTSANASNTGGTIHFGGGVLDLQGGNIVEGGGRETFNFTDGTLKDVAIIDFTSEETTLNREFEQSGGTFQIGADDTTDTTTIKADFTASGGVIEIQIAGTNGAGVAGGHDQIIVNPENPANDDGAVDLTGSSLSLGLLGGFVAPAGSTYVIIDNDGSADSVSGTFAGLPESATVTVGGQDFVITYVGGDGNDVVLFAGPPETHVELSAGGILEITDITSDSENDITVSYDAVANTYTISEADAASVISTAGVTVISRTANSVTISGVGITAIDIDTTDPGTSVVGVDDKVTVTTSGELSLAGEISITSDDITISDADISSGADISLNAGDHFVLESNGELEAASGSITITVDQVGTNDASGGTVDLSGTVTAGSEVFIEGGSEGDTFNVKPSTNSEINIDGNDPGDVPGDVINLIDAVDADFDPLTPATDGAGTYTFGGGQQRIDFQEVENDNLAPVIIVGGGDSAGANLTETDSPLNVTGTLTVHDLGNVDATINGAVGIAGSPDLLTNADFLAMFRLTSPNPIVTAPATMGTISWEFDSNATTFDFLALGETLTLTYTITASDPATGSDTQTVTIKITGTNDDPVLTEDVVTVFEGGEGGSETVSGNALANDSDVDINGQGIDDVLKVVNTRFDGTPFGGATNPGGAVVEGGLTKVDGLYGTLSIDADGNFVYTVDGNLPTTRALDTGDVGVETFIYLVSDGSGGFVEEQIVVRVVGSTGGKIGEFFGVGGSGILEGFRFAERQTPAGESVTPLLLLMPTYSGTALPGSVITLTVMGADGSVLRGGSMTVVADLSGGWIAKFSGLEIGNTSYFVKVETAAPAWSSGVKGSFEVFFAPAINGSHAQGEVLTVDSVMGRRLNSVAFDDITAGNAHPNGSNDDWRKANGIADALR
ncbi:MAG: VCBS domain-containing protein, partial [Verrucomicrobiales bacterium]|nr:VCBS domain-containing protein [Verrucomicrobiales bacterium]